MVYTSKKRPVFLDAVQNLMFTSRNRAVFLDAVQNLMSTSKKRGLFLEAGSQIEVHLRHFCRVIVGGRHKASRASSA